MLPPDITNTAHRRWIARYPEKHATHHAVDRALKQGLLTRPTCEECGTPCKPTAHHDDYSQPLVVRWLCPRCHSRADRQRLCRLR